MLNGILQDMLGILDAIVAIGYQQLHIIECLDEVYWGIRGQTIGGD